jgi:hypothetical protein
MRLAHTNAHLVDRCSARCNYLHRPVGDSFCKCFNKVGVASSTDPIDGNTHQLAVINGGGERVAAAGWRKIGINFNVNKEGLRLQVFLWVNTVGRIKSDVAYADAVTLSWARRAIRSIGIWPN